MNHMQIYLTVLGWYNLAGALFMFTLLSVSFGDRFMRKTCDFLAVPYTLGSFGKSWLWWAAMLNVFYAFVNIKGAFWGTHAMHDIMLMNIMLYGIFLLLNTIACFNQTYSKGMYFNIFLFSFWLSWGAYVFMGS